MQDHGKCRIASRENHALLERRGKCQRLSNPSQATYHASAIVSDDSGQSVSGARISKRQSLYEPLLGNRSQEFGIAHLHMLMKTLRGDQQQQQQRAEDRQQRRRVEAGASSLPNTKKGVTLRALIPSYPDSTTLDKLAARCILAPSFPTGTALPSRRPPHFPTQVDLLIDIGVAEFGTRKE